MKFNLKTLMILAVAFTLVLTACGTAATQAPTTAAPAAATEVDMWTYYGDTGPAAACVNTAAADYNAAQSKYAVKSAQLR